MPTYFAYGANMDVEAMGRRCPASVPLGPARLVGHRFLVMRDGTASVRPSPGATVHGLLWTLALADVRALDRFEEVEAGLYRKAVRPVLKVRGGSAQALIYIGRTVEEGPPQPGYMEAVLASARALGFPEPYRRALASLFPAGGRSPGGGARRVWRSDTPPPGALSPDRRRS